MEYRKTREELYKNLRCYQKEAIEEILEIFNGNSEIKSILRQNFTGTGKSVEQNFLAIDWLSQSEDNSYLFLIHREELLENAARYFKQAELPYTFIRKGFKTLYSKRAFLAGIDYFKSDKRLQEFRDYLTKYNKKLFIVIDECHHIAAKSWKKIVNYFPEANKVGFSATPERLDGQGFDDLFQHLILGKPYQWYIDNQFVSPFQMIVPKQIEMQLTRGDSLNEQEEAMTSEILGDAVGVWEKHTPGLKTFCFCPTLEVSKQVADLYNQLGQEKYGKDIAMHLDGGRSIKKEDRSDDYISPTEMKKIRRDAIRRFNLPSDHPDSLLILTNVELFIEGVDVKDCQVTQHLRFTHSEIYYDQMNGRSNRYLPGKMQYIIDHVGNHIKHGLPNRDRFYDLKGKKKREKEAKYALFCMNCNHKLADDYRQIPPGADWVSCGNCGADTLVPLPKIRTRKKAEKTELEFEDTEFTVLSSNYYQQINREAMFTKYNKIKSDRKFMDEIARVSSDLQVLIEATKYRNISESHAIAAWSRRQQNSVF